MRTARATLKGFYIMRMIHCSQCLSFNVATSSEIRFIDKLLKIAAEGLVKPSCDSASYCIARQARDSLAKADDQRSAAHQINVGAAT